MSNVPQATAAAGKDRFGNPIDTTVSYARGQILRSNADEVIRQRRTYEIARQRHAALGDGSLFNLTGLIRGFRFKSGDPAKLHSYTDFGAIDTNEIVPSGLAFMGGEPASHDALLCNRVSAAALSTMLALLKPGQVVHSVVAADRCHPSIKNSVAAAGAKFCEFVGPAAFEAALRQGAGEPAMVVITTISPSKHHMPEKDVRAAIATARRVGALVVLDDAHMAARLSLYGETPPLAMGADIAFWSLDKHLTGPRSGMLAGHRELVAKIRTTAFMFGLEAQIGSIVAGLNAMTDFDPSPIREAAAFSEQVMSELQPILKGRAYRAGAGIAISGEDLLEIACQESGASRCDLVPIEATAAAAMALLQNTGAITIPVSGMPGSACVYRLMMYPDGQRLGAQAIVEGTRQAISTVAGMLTDIDAARGLIMGR